MIDLKLLREDPDRVRRSQAARGEDVAAVDTLLAADERRRAAVATADAARAEQKALGKRIARADRDERPVLLAEAGSLAAAVKAAEAEQAAAEAAMRAAHLAVANVVVDGVPPGGEDQSVVVATVGEIPAYAFPPRDHLAVGQAVGAIDTDRGAKVSGARFFFLTGPGALLELALLNFAFARAVANGFTPMIPPVLVKPSAMEGTGFLGAHSDEIYRLEADDLYLVGTSEVPLAAYHADEILDLSTPRRYAAFSSCFRREAGSYGKDVKGIIRVHQFDKVEMFVYCRPEEAEAEHQRLLAHEREILDALELPYRVVDIAAGDLGSSAARKYDCEAWLPSQARYREVTSTSNCTDFQARRLQTRFRDPETGRPRVAATLNGTLVAMARTIVAILEVHQQPDGSVRVPTALRPYLGGAAELPVVG